MHILSMLSHESQTFTSVETPRYAVMAYNTTTLATASGQGFFHLITNEVRRICQLITYVSLCGFISFFGVGSNVVNIAVFARQGCKDGINISWLALAVADLSCSITMFWTSMCYNPLFQSLDLPIEYMDIMYLTGGWPHVCFNRITSFITVFITLERCLCIATPLKVKTIITPFRTKIINIFIFISMFVLFSPFYYVNKLGWAYNQHRNRTIFSLYFTDDRNTVESATFSIHSGVLSCIFLISITICTIVLVVKLKQKTKWRKRSVANTSSNQEVTSVKDQKVVKMITLISTIFIVCYIPPTVNCLYMAWDPEFSIAGTLQNPFFMFWSVACVLETVNSSVNIFVYFNMSTKFRATLFELFCSVVKQ